MSKNVALSTVVTMGTNYIVAQKASLPPTTTNAALRAVSTLAGHVTVTPGIPD